MFIWWETWLGKCPSLALYSCTGHQTQEPVCLSRPYCHYLRDGQSSHTLAQSNTSRSSFLLKCIEGIISTQYCFHKWSWSRLLVCMVSFVSLRRRGASLVFDNLGRALQVKALDCKDHTWLTWTREIIWQRKVMAGPIRVVHRSLWVGVTQAGSYPNLCL